MASYGWRSAAAAWIACLAITAPARPEPVFRRDVRVVVDASRPVNTFTPVEAMGAALDGMEKDEVRTYLTPYNIKKLQEAGLRRLTYRTRPELGVEVWHWTEAGSWSDPARQEGYWTG